MPASLESVLKNDKEHDLRARVFAAVHDFPLDGGAEAFANEERYFLGYPAFLLSKIKRRDLGPEGKKASEDKASRLERLISQLGSGELKEDEDSTKKRYAHSDIYNDSDSDDGYGKSGNYDYYNKIIFTKAHERYQLSVFDPEKDDEKKINRLVRGVGMCWDKWDYPYLSGMIAADAKLNGGLVLYGIKRKHGKCYRTVAVVRDFIGIDKAGNTYLFIDTVEGWNKPGVSHHDLDIWAEKEPGALKLAILSSIWLAKKVGVDYLAAGDEPVKRVFRAIGATKIKTWNGDSNYKIGYPAVENPREDDPTGGLKVKSYFFNDEKNYALITNEKFSKKKN